MSIAEDTDAITCPRPDVSGEISIQELSCARTTGTRRASLFDTILGSLSNLGLDDEKAEPSTKHQKQPEDVDARMEVFVPDEGPASEFFERSIFVLKDGLVTLAPPEATEKHQNTKKPRRRGSPLLDVIDDFMDGLDSEGYVRQ
mmetsp:Transcript_33839/g.69080  ORF Transcript_33839/g.69080 Transcript_33839/m.69080 type:complete len:144 (-) Transcript_33839:170-601(-)|eukprot:CAMPEP_0183302984 /NCGR_PEP_ID=MMETSP0160_2-20130417/8592_1 /TAXON_ID=2839 ORGANISM="Odontella Sinensis, Strain Grunow 1884" /NCGR_SAMPLE_ID=MMETSP0160_2 /ASSEMBLY_ACC=CAM_ASM_000250 /LENGTH=143 /DNA_ID=CAMNT_0025465835 /DNA_START=191 /DNA_END=622 /DNA_ORIENTATION=+